MGSARSGDAVDADLAATDATALGATAGATAAASGGTAAAPTTAPTVGTAPAGTAAEFPAPAPAIAPGLARFLRPRPRPSPGEQCEFCATPLSSKHSHVVDIEGRRLACSCRACWFLFAPEGAASGRYKAVQERSVRYPEFDLDDRAWDEMQIPVGIAFFFVNSAMGSPAAFYPGPAGATESLLPLDVWVRLLAQNPPLQLMADDIEALLVHRPKDALMECFIVPIDACYELVGVIRKSWKGFDGGAEAWSDIGAFFDDLRDRSELPRIPAASA